MEPTQKAVATDYQEIKKEGLGPVILMCTLLVLFLVAIIYVGVSSF